MVIGPYSRIAFAVAGLALLLITCRASAHEVSVHESITERAIDFLVQQRPELKACKSPALRSALVTGVSAEDEIKAFGFFGNFFFHFFPRLNDSVKLPALQRLPFLDEGGGWTSISGSCSSHNWAFDADPLCLGRAGPLTYESAPNEFRYDFVLQQLALVGPEKKNKGWIGLGHFLHLIQDLTSPAHVRNDAHPHTFQKFSSDTYFPELSDPSKFELLNALRSVHLPNGFLLQFADERSAFSSLQSWVAANFYSEKNTNVPPGPSGTVGPDYYVRDNMGRRIAKLEPIKGAFVIDDVIAGEQFSELAPEAVRWTASMINFIHETRVPICEEQLVVQTVGKGTVTSSPNGISCGTTCDYYFPAGRTVTLTAVPDSSTGPFLEWSGDVDAAKCPPKQTTCVIEMNDEKPKNVTAIFLAPPPPIAGIYELVSYRGIPMGGFCGEAQGCGSVGFYLVSGTANMTSSTWGMQIVARYENVPGQPDPVAIYSNSGNFRFDRLTTSPLNVPQDSDDPNDPNDPYCTGAPHNVPGSYYCGQLPPGWLYDFEFWAFPNQYYPMTVQLPDDSLVSAIGGQTVWRKVK